MLIRCADYDVPPTLVTPDVDDVPVPVPPVPVFVFVVTVVPVPPDVAPPFTSSISFSESSEVVLMSLMSMLSLLI